MNRRKGNGKESDGKGAEDDTQRKGSTNSKAQEKGKAKHAKKGGAKRRWAIVMAIIAVTWGLYHRRQQVRVAVEPILDPLISNMPEFNFTEFAGRHGITLPDVFQSEEAPRPGRELAQKGWKPKHPIIIVPGFVTSGLELWAGKPCAARYFRQRIWGSLSMTQSFMGDKACWLEHMALDNNTGLDPEGVRLRASEGLLGVDYFFPGYAVWAKLIEAAADMGYETNNLIGETYDWRLSVPNMETRDKYFTRLKWRIELTMKTEGEKVLVASHSWGDNVFRNFMVWIGEDDPDWIENHIAAYVNIAGPVLGVSKSMTSLLSGETRDTAELGLIGAFLSDNLVPRNERVKLFRTWGSAMGMLPVGGPDIWGNTTWAPDDTPEMTKQNVSFGPLITETLIPEQADEDEDKPNEEHKSFAESVHTWVSNIFDRGNKTEIEKIVKKHDVDSAVRILLRNGGSSFEEKVIKWGAVHADERSCKASKGSPEEYYYNPLKCPLPKAPSMQFFCLYGIGLPTERSYYYLNLESDKAMRKSEEESETHQQYEVRWKMDKDASGERHGGEISYGVRTSDGDGTVPLISTGVMCQKHWREKQLNPSGLRVVSREYPHEPVAAYKDLRGGPRSADHVDILGHMDVLSDILTIASGHGDQLEDKIISDVKRIADNIKLDVGCD
ncbi:hypothetical protein WJX75_007445 [Coccomyxa subellipsoidea]|uniref:Phospholipid:diacylglycerol acyltransferase n=1 Tax=Coccomyxa subellipsoidea TaxID=248742 RepID=A0ABR2Z4C8_9CHLO